MPVMFLFSCFKQEPLTRSASWWLIGPYNIGNLGPTLTGIELFSKCSDQNRSEATEIWNLWPDWSPLDQAVRRPLVWYWFTPRSLVRFPVMSWTQIKFCWRGGNWADQYLISLCIHLYTLVSGGIDFYLRFESKRAPSEFTIDESSLLLIFMTHTYSE